MSAAVSANLMGITGIARRLVLDGAMDEASARKAMEASASGAPAATCATLEGGADAGSCGGGAFAGIRDAAGGSAGD